MSWSCAQCGLPEAAHGFADHDFADETDDRCISCGAEIDHYLGCPDDPNPDYEAEAQSLEEMSWESLGHGNAPMGEL